MNHFRQTVIGAVAAVLVSGCGNSNGGGGGGVGDDVLVGSNSGASGVFNPSGGVLNPTLDRNNVCGDLVTYPSEDVLRLRSRDEDAWHLFELDVRIEHPGVSYDQLFDAREELDAEVKLLIPQIITQMQENSDFIAAGGIYDDWQVLREEHAMQFNGATVLFDEFGQVSGLDTPDGYVGLLFEPPGTCGGELLVRIGFQKPGLPNVSIDLGQQFETRNYPLGYGILYRYSRGSLESEFDFTQTFYTKLGLLPIVNFQSQPERGVLEDQESRDWSADYAVTEAMIIALRQLRTGNAGNGSAL